MDRVEAINIICKHQLAQLSKEERWNTLLAWWGIDSGDRIYHALSSKLQWEIDNTEEPPPDIKDDMYEPLLIEDLKSSFIGVTNEYISSLLSSIINEETQVTGNVEELYACHCCNYLTLEKRGHYDICPVCFWEDDGGSNSPERYSSCNHMTLREGKMNFVYYGWADIRQLDKKIINKANRYIKAT